jgi:hypothetical protein
MRIIARFLLLLLLVCLAGDYQSKSWRRAYQVIILTNTLLKPGILFSFSRVTIPNNLSGTAFAVDSNGLLLTARHVVDVADTNQQICRRGFSEDKKIFLNILVADVYGRIWNGYAEAEDSDESFCN